MRLEKWFSPVWGQALGGRVERKAKQMMTTCQSYRQRALRSVVLVLFATGLLPSTAFAQVERSSSVLAPRTALSGDCEYDQRAAQYLDGTNGFALCDSIVIVRHGESATFDYREEGRGSSVIYKGELSGDEMAIRSVQLRGKPAREAKGTCTVYRREGRISTVTCIAIARHLTFAANFVPDD